MNIQIFFKMSLCEVVEPLDYEECLAQHQMALDRDPLKSILDFPPNDVDCKKNPNRRTYYSTRTHVIFLK